MTTQIPMIQRTRLSVLVPTYNRTHLLPAVARSLDQIRRSNPEIDWEFVVSDNCSPAQIDEEGLQACCSGLKLIRTPRHFPTAEENLFYGLKRVSGDFVWLLGDDDEINLGVVKDLVARVLSGDSDFIVYNSGIAAPDGRLISPMRTYCRASELRISILDFVQRTGATFCIAGFSTTVLRREHLKLDLSDELLGTSKIYSHVIVWLRSFFEKRFVFVNRPLVNYRQNGWDLRHREHDHWQQFAIAEGCFLKYPWTLGLVRLFKNLEEAGIVARTFCGSVIDQNLERRFRLIHLMALALLEQIVSEPFLASKLTMKSEEFAETMSFLRSTAPDQHELWRVLEQARAAIRRANLFQLRYMACKAEAAVRGILEQRFATVPAMAFFSGITDGNLIVDSPWGYREVPLGAVDTFVERSRCIDFDLASGSLDEHSESRRSEVTQEALCVVSPPVAAPAAPGRPRRGLLPRPLRKAIARLVLVSRMYSYRRFVHSGA